MKVNNYFYLDMKVIKDDRASINEGPICFMIKIKMQMIMKIFKTVKNLIIYIYYTVLFE